MAYHGNQLRFGKLTMNGADLTLVDMDPHDPFDFYLDHYLQQVEAGYTKITGNFGLRVSMKDFDSCLHRADVKQAGSDRKALIDATDSILCGIGHRGCSPQLRADFGCFFRLIHCVVFRQEIVSGGFYPPSGRSRLFQ
jgi:hypothetical protein